MERFKQIKEKLPLDKRFLGTMGICIFVFLLMGLLFYYEVFEFVELKALEFRYWLYSKAHSLHPSPELVLAQIDNESQQNEPFKGEDWRFWDYDDYLFPLVNSLAEAQVNSIGVTMWLRRKDSSYEKFSAEVPNAKDYLFLASAHPYLVNRGDKGIPLVKIFQPLETLRRNSKGTGFAGYISDKDGFYRWAQLVLRDENSDGEVKYSLTVQLMKNYLQADEIQLDEAAREILLMKDGKTKLKIPINDKGQMLITFTPKSDSFITKPIYVMLQPYEIEGHQDEYQGKIVLLGLEREIQGAEKYLTPQGQMSGLLLQAQIINTILSSNFITRWGKMANLFSLFALCIISAFLALILNRLKRQTPYLIIQGNLALLALYTVFVVLAFLFLGVWIDLISPALAIVLCGISTTIYLNHQELREQNIKLRDAQDKIAKREREAAFGQMAAAVRHEFGNLSQNISWAAEDLQQIIAADERFKQNNRYDKMVESIDDIVRVSNIMGTMIKDELNYLREITLDTEEYVTPVLEKALNSVSNMIGEHNVKVRMQKDGDALKMKMNEEQLFLAFVNLIKNAYEAMPDGGKLEIRIQNYAEENSQETVVIKISDTGIGMTPEQQSHIFEPFYTRRKSRGLGLGMTNVKRIIEGHNGTIEVKSEIDKGTTFVITIPIL